MIKSCTKCGGLYTTENLESFAGTPCKCAAPSPVVAAEVEAADALRKATEPEEMK